jgi:hypothetical protein
MVTIGEYERTTKRSPGSAHQRAPRGEAARTRVAGLELVAIEQQHARHDSLVPTWKADRGRAS